MKLSPAARRASLIAAVAALLLSAGCESVRNYTPALITPYRPDITQGNVVTREMADQLRQGMSREQVRFMLGTPLLASVLHEDRWDYVYHLKRGRTGETQTRRLTVFFKDNRVERFVSDELPNETEADNLILGRNPKFLPRPPAQSTASEQRATPPGPIVD